MTDQLGATERICRCPSCGERFLLPDDVLAQARNSSGNVRCGACLSVFNAEANLVAAAEPSFAAPLDPPPLSPSPPDFADAPPAEPAAASQPAQALSDEPSAVEQAPSDGDDVPGSGTSNDNVPISPPLRGARLAPTPGQRRGAKSKEGSRTGLWAVLAIVGLVLLGGQLLVLLFPAGVQTPEWRGVYVAACKVIGCSVPALRSVDAIDVVDPSVERQASPETLQFRARLVNNAAFAQRLPRLSLRFLGADGTTVGEQRVSPSDYREGSKGRLAPNESIPVTVQVADPGANAVNYSVTLL